jgi:two-component system, sensor histidine kinase
MRLTLNGRGIVLGFLPIRAGSPGWGEKRAIMNDISQISRHLLQFSPDALVVVDARGVIQFANDTVTDLFGYQPSELVGKKLEILVPERFRIRHGAHISAYSRDPTNREMGARLNDLFARRADGSEFPAGIRLAAFRAGEDSFVAAAVRDMTERRQISDALVAAREEADRANRAKTRFLATASHDLRQPLQTIRLLNASLQKMSAAAPEVADLLRRQENAIDGATRLLNTLLDINRMESGAIEPQMGEVNLGDIFADLAQEFAPAAEAKGVTLEFSDGPVALSTDRMLLTQLLQNLIGNALKYTDRGKVSVSQTLDSDALTVKIEDTGIGIPEEKLDRIFDEYYQVDKQGTKRLGVGLGLAIVREVARLLGFSVAVTSKLGQGTRVRVRIPRQKVLNQSARNVPAVTLAKANGAHPSCRVVLLEDNDSVRTATELFLSLEGYDTQSAGSVAEAEEMLTAMRPGDVLITDYHLDGSLTGLDVLHQLRARQGRPVPAVMLSGDLQSMLRAVKTEIPNCRFLSKPVDTKALVAAISELRDT